MKARVALVTNKSLHHKYWVAEMCKRHQVVCIIHPSPKSNTSLKNIVATKGYWHVLLLLLTKIYYRFAGSNSKTEFKEQSQKWFNEATGSYQQLDQRIIHHMATVNSPEALALVAQYKVDVICFLGGDIAGTEFIHAAKLACLNFHSGISPIYNGSKSYLWPMAENRPNLVGGTLMKMNEKIDGGEILSQFLPEITVHDNASSLFMKCIVGSVALFSKAINTLESGLTLHGVVQERSIRYTKSQDWTLYQEIQLAAFYKSGNIRKYVRGSQVFEPAALEEKLFVADCFRQVLSYNVPKQ